MPHPSFAPSLWPPPPCIYMCVFFSVVFLHSLTRTSCIVPSSAVSLFVDTSTHCTSSGCIDAPVTTHVSFLFWSFCLCSLPSPHAVCPSFCVVPRPHSHPLHIASAPSPGLCVASTPRVPCVVNTLASARCQHPIVNAPGSAHCQHPDLCALSTLRPLHIINAPASAQHPWLCRRPWPWLLAVLMLQLFFLPQQLCAFQQPCLHL